MPKVPPSCPPTRWPQLRAFAVARPQHPATSFFRRSWLQPRQSITPNYSHFLRCHKPDTTGLTILWLSQQARLTTVTVFLCNPSQAHSVRYTHLTQPLQSLRIFLKVLILNSLTSLTSAFHLLLRHPGGLQKTWFFLAPETRFSSQPGRGG